jgi:4,5-dihydroxyphthalate decarboxylase
MAKLTITLALGSYDRHAPLLEGRIDHADVKINYIELDPQQGRHERFLQDFEFDAAELSLSSYLIAIDHGLPVHAVPIFPRRLFSQSQMYKNIHCGIAAPADLAGKKDRLERLSEYLGSSGQRRFDAFLWRCAIECHLGHSGQGSGRS